MKCSHCCAHNSPAALECYGCGAAFEAAPDERRMRTHRSFGAWMASVGVISLLAAMHQLGLVAGRIVQ